MQCYRLEFKIAGYTFVMKYLFVAFDILIALIVQYLMCKFFTPAVSILTFVQYANAYIIQPIFIERVRNICADPYKTAASILAMCIIYVVFHLLCTLP